MEAHVDDSHAIEVEDLRKVYGDVKVLNGIDLTVERGSMVALLGPNGAGKTTLVRILTTLIPATSGTARVHGHDVARQADDVRRSIGLVNQFMALDYVHTGRENLVMLGRLQRLGTAGARGRADELLERFELTEAADRPVSTYSGGMRRRLDLAISLITAPPVLFLDEPTVGLDPRSRLGMWDAIKSLVASGSTVFLTTQYLEEADQLADRVAVLDQGRIIAQGTPEELKARVGSERMEIAFPTPEDFSAARGFVGEERVGWNADEMKASIAVDDVAYLVGKLGEIERSGARMGSLALVKPSLDDVFMELTENAKGRAERASERAGQK
ncbi:ATP-binding cassette domain-containing protein [Streptomyces millisiae]|uniref:ATP-binding cassette domain-containing protein n=1 Tax=Streptomyces millisiae TaxID=3075542 RepID=A0ABU2LQF1_9ACTN|nr:ATP-binding cassette domain-containing protein [Streptomyces sp. DSM 44918]MDT0319806.1 ATP-binding cassette domain-containing protein [Streptomyces sp. DSM 44918]